MLIEPLRPRDEPNLACLVGRTLYVVGDVHLHVGSSASLVDDLQRLVDGIGSRDPEACIVFNGDAFDLDQVGDEPASGIGEERAARRIERIFGAFPTLTQTLAGHVHRGGVLLFVAGNHDAELLLSAPQRVIKEHLVWQAHGEGGDDSAAQRILVVEKFDFAHVLIEHGHQNDPDSAFFPDMRSAVDKQRLSAFPLASLLTRLFLSKNPRFEALGDNYKTPLPVLLRVLRDYKLAAFNMIFGYPIHGLRIAWLSVLARVRNDAPRPTGAVSMSSPWTVMGRMYLDRYFASVLALLLLVGVLTRVLDMRFWWILAAIAIYLVVPPVRSKRFFHRDLHRCEGEALAHSANGTRLVVFGHTHHAFVREMGNATYANHGAFSLPVEIDEQGRICGNGGPASRSVSTKRRARTYLTITTEPLGCSLGTLASA